MMSEYIYITVAYAVLIFTFSFCGVLRWCNLFPHVIKNMEEFYPARKLVVCIYFYVLLLFPCMLHPRSYDAQLLARCFWIVYVPSAASLAFRRFFSFTDINRREILLVGCVPAVVLLLLFAFAIAGGDALRRYGDMIVGLIEVMSVALTVNLVRVTLWIWNMLHGRTESLCRPFPRRFASGIFWIPLLVQLVAWGAHLSGSAAASAALAVATALAGAVILVAILRPQRVGNESPGFADSPLEEESDGDTQEVSGESTEEAMKLPIEVIDRIEQQVRNAVEHDRMYLNPDLTKAKLASMLGTNDLYMHIVLKKWFGPFNKYINTLRMEYAIRYENEHPEVKREELALKSGFGSVRTYYRAKAQYEREIKPEI